MSGAATAREVSLRHASDGCSRAGGAEGTWCATRRLGLRRAEPEAGQIFTAEDSGSEGGSAARWYTIAAKHWYTIAAKQRNCS